MGYIYSSICIWCTPVYFSDCFLLQLSVRAQWLYRNLIQNACTGENSSKYWHPHPPPHTGIIQMFNFPSLYPEEILSFPVWSIIFHISSILFCQPLMLPVSTDGKTIWVQWASKEEIDSFTRFIYYE